MAEEYKNASEEFKPEHETPKITTTTTKDDSPSDTTPEVKDRGMFDFLKKKKEEVKPEDTPLTRPTPPSNIESEFEHKAQISEQPASVTKHEEEEKKEPHHSLPPSLLEQLHQKHEDEEENKPSLLHKLHRSNSSSSSSSDEEGENGERKKKEKKKKEDKTIVIEQGQVQTEEEKKGIAEKIKEKLPGHHGTKAADHHDASVVNTTTPVVAPVKTEDTVEHPTEKKGFMDKIKEKLPGYHAKTDEEKKEKESDV